MLRRLPIPNSMNKLTVMCVLLVIQLGSPFFLTSAKQAQQCDTMSGRIEPTAVPSAVYGKPIVVNVYLPPCYAANQPASYPVIYLLHGGNADETQWPDLNVQVAADTLISQGASPFIVIMPGATYSDS